MIVTITTGTLSAPRSEMSRSSASTSMLPLNGCSAAGSWPSAMTRSTASAPVNSTFARVVSKWVLLGTTLPGPPIGCEQDLLGGAALMRRDHVLEGEELADGVEEDEPGRRAGVALVAVLDRGPLVAGHRAGAGVGEEVDEDVGGVEAEDVVPGVADRRRRYSGVVSRSGSTEWMRNGSKIVVNMTVLIPARVAPGIGVSAERAVSARSRAPSSKRASPEESASPARAGRNRGT